jgi:hypothetical protein
MWVDIQSLYMNAAQHVKSEIRIEGVHGFLISARSLCCETRQDVYELLCTYVKREDSAQVRWVVIRLSENRTVYSSRLFYETFFITPCRLFGLSVYRLEDDECRVLVCAHKQETTI